MSNKSTKHIKSQQKRLKRFASLCEMQTKRMNEKDKFDNSIWKLDKQQIQ